jgi:hypothetical protein
VSQQHDTKKARYWQAVIRDAARSGMSTRAFCRQRKLKESQFYWWQRRLKEKRPAVSPLRGREDGPANFALVSGDAGTSDAGIELVLAGGRRLRIAKGVDEPTLRSVLAALEQQGC